MIIKFYCIDCGRKLRIDARYSGGWAACPQCGQKQAVPEAAGSAEPVVEAPEQVEAQAVSRADATEPEPIRVGSGMHIDFEDLIDMTAMVDIVFFLLIFFLVTSLQSVDSSIPMPAPDARKGGSGGSSQTLAEIDADDSNIVVRIDRNDRIWVEGAEARDERDLMLRLRDLQKAAARPEQMLVLGHGMATHGTMVSVLDAGHEIGLKHVKMAIQDDVE